MFSNSFFSKIPPFMTDNVKECGAARGARNDVTRLSFYNCEGMSVLRGME